jgi:hypothetical protein
MSDSVDFERVGLSEDEELALVLAMSLEEQPTPVPLEAELEIFSKQFKQTVEYQSRTNHNRGQPFVRNLNIFLTVYWSSLPRSCSCDDTNCRHVTSEHFYRIWVFASLCKDARDAVQAFVRKQELVPKMVDCFPTCDPLVKLPLNAPKDEVDEYLLTWKPDHKSRLGFRRAMKDFELHCGRRIVRCKCVSPAWIRFLHANAAKLGFALPRAVVDSEYIRSAAYLKTLRDVEWLPGRFSTKVIILERVHGARLVEKLNEFFKEHRLWKDVYMS